MGGKRWLSKGILVFSYLWLGWPNSSYARDTIKPGEAVRFSEQLVSANGLFRLGFFSVRNVNYRYFGLLYMEDTFSRKVIIWVANRGKPVIGTTADVTMDTNGMLQIIHQDGDPIPLNSKDQAAKNSSATLTDSGNFVLTEWNLDGSAKRVLWQTFDYSTDTLLPGMKLGENFQTGKKWSLSSWISDRVPAPGAFTLEWNYTENGRGQLTSRIVYWTSGLLNVADQSFENIVWLRDDYYRDIYNFTVVSSETESYFTHSVPNGNMTILVLNSDQSNGTLIDSDKRVFGPSGLCNGIDPNPGCEAERAPECRSSNEKFESRAGQFVGGRYLSDGNMSLGFSDCWAQCWNNCSCAGYNASYPNGTGCQQLGVSFGAPRQTSNKIFPVLRV
ncbi:LOW QUALITY PROTEIN: hypothetical protein RJ639_046361 [Escallonia herrerae]|uniref:Bulb-type lectin domain-containing protein n=1 Tax=Escallonia herrerae TaxID=1293975 RepID=A0AA88W7T3_9ASTE|nr:LOW QUALITY PROTEIN: hypothetical protein RJ639_046361 [Escallonia herrerae]